MDAWQAILLGVIQGLAEFLPISSSGHLVLVQTLLGIKEPVMTFDVLLHVGTLVPVCYVYREDLLGMLKHPFQKQTWLLAIGTVPAVFVALFLGDKVEMLFHGGLFLSAAFFLTGMFLLYADTVQDGHKQIDDMTWLDALLIGCMQAIAIMPAVSRSGSTITGSLARKLDRKTAAKYSFMLSIPAILGAVVLEFKKILEGQDVVGNIEMMPMFLGFMASMVTGYFAITLMIKLIERSKLRWFAIYVFVLGALVLAAQLVTSFRF